MVTTSVKIMTPGERMKARIKRVRDMARVPGVRVVPASGEGFTEEQMRRLLKHPTAGHFRSEGSIEWPHDQYTKKRLREGSIKLADDQPARGEHRSLRAEHREQKE